MKPQPKRRSFNDPEGSSRYLVYRKTMFGRCYCIKSFCHLKTLENASKSSFLYYYNGAQKHKGVKDLENAGFRADLRHPIATK